MKYLCMTMLAAALSPAVMAAGGGSISYSYLEARITNVDVDNLSDETGFGVTGSISFGDHIYGFVSYDNADFDLGSLSSVSLNLQELKFGMGYHHTFADRLDGLAEVSFVDSEIGNFNENGYNLSVGFRFAATEQLELGAKVGYQNVDEALDGAAGQAHLLYTFGETLGINILADFSDEITRYGIGLRASF